MGRETLILHGTYRRALFAKALEAGYLTPDPRGSEYLISNFTPREVMDFDLEQTSHNKHKSEVLQMFLLFNNTILADKDDNYDYSKLLETGIVKQEKLTIGHFDGPSLDPATRAYAMLLKDIVVRSLAKGQSRNLHDMMRVLGITPKAFYNVVYTQQFGEAEDIASLNPKQVEVVERYAKGRLWTYVNDENRYPPVHGLVQRWLSSFGSHTGGQILNSFFVQVPVIVTTQKLIGLLNLSSMNDAVLMQSDFDMTGFKTVAGLIQKSETRSIMNSYKLLRLSYQQLIGSLPALNSLDDVLRLKETKRKDIERLRLVVNEMEQLLRNGEIQAIQQAGKEIRQAAGELARGQNVERVGRWSTFLALPVGIIELLTGLPPVASMSIGVAGVGTTLSTEVAKAKNGWLQVLR